MYSVQTRQPPVSARKVFVKNIGAPGQEKNNNWDVGVKYDAQLMIIIRIGRYGAMSTFILCVFFYYYIFSLKIRC